MKRPILANIDHALSRSRESVLLDLASTAKSKHSDNRAEFIRLSRLLSGQFEKLVTFGSFFEGRLT